MSASLTVVSFPKRRFRFAAPVAEQLDPISGGRRVVAHVLDQAENGHVHFVEHADAFADDTQRRFLRSGDNDTAIQRHGLAKGELRIARAGR